MKLEEAIKTIIKQNGDCSGVSCVGRDNDDCPCFGFCSKELIFNVEYFKNEKHNICFKLFKPKTTQEEFEI